MKKYLAIILLLLLCFYYTYPQALNFFGSSFIVPSAVVGISLYAYHRFPFKEVLTILLAFAGILFFCYLTMFINSTSDDFWKTYLRSQMGFFFTAYLIIAILFKIHKKPTVNILIGYIVGAIALQCVLSLAMYFNDSLSDFLFSIQLQSVFDEEKRNAIEGHRLMGYGTGLFGAGMVCGYALILLIYLIMRLKVTTTQFILLAILYCFIFFIGLMNARTTTVGLGVSLIFLAILYFMDHRVDKKRAKIFIVSSILLFIGGYSLSYLYFPQFTDWAFELFDNFVNKGELTTKSSEGLVENISLPTDVVSRLIGTGSSVFFGIDVGYTRLVAFFGLLGTTMYFLYEFIIAKQCLTKDWSLNILILTIVVYCMIINIKGLTDFNPVLYLFFFFFMFYKYYIYIPKIELQQRQIAKDKKLKQEQTDNG